jgi:hypothetical protein
VSTYVECGVCVKRCPFEVEIIAKMRADARHRTAAALFEGQAASLGRHFVPLGVTERPAPYPRSRPWVEENNESSTACAFVLRQKASRVI